MRLTKEWIGKKVTVVMDRPMGTYHPERPDVYYTINYGYLPGTMADDGEPIDAYVLGPEIPLATYDGEVIAIVKREDDVEDKLVVSDRKIPANEIMDQIRTYEKKYKSSIQL